MPRIVIIDVTASADPAMIRRAVVHAGAFETNDTPLYIVEGEGMVEDTTIVRLKHEPVLQTNERGGVASLVSRLLFKDESIIPVVYATSPGVHGELVDALGHRRAEIRCANPDAWNAAYNGDDCGWTAREMPHSKAWRPFDVHAVIETLTYMAAQARKNVTAFKTRLDIDADDAFEDADNAMQAQCQISACEQTLDELRQVGAPRIGAGDHSARDVSDFVARELDSAVRKTRTLSSSTATLMNHGRMIAWYQIHALFDKCRQVR